MSTKNFGPSASDIQNHLYTSFLEGSTADVALRVHGSWNAIYKLHRVVLIQSGFFRSLFTAGFAESSPRLGSTSIPEEIVIYFDDPNITRAAFEVCISRLYGGGPVLDIDPALIPSVSHPLTPSFPLELPHHKVPDGHHPATPCFLLSLLATAVYLSIPFLASQALSSILNTVGPHTVLQYLSFALGRPLEQLDYDSCEHQAAVGLESVANLIAYEQSIVDTASIRSRSNIPEDSHIKLGRTSNLSISSGSEEYETEGVTNQPSYHYGALSDKIGEACACWLARWGVDIFGFEEKQEVLHSSKEHAHATPSTRKRSKTAPSGSAPALTEKPEDYCVPKIWARDGLDPKWVSAIISADTFFIRGEKERYEFARRVVESRRKHGILPSEEEEWAKLFQSGIYYTNMIMDDLILISRDISPTTNQPFVPLSTIQSCLWAQSVLRHHITVRPATSRSTSSPIPSPPPREKELALPQPPSSPTLKTSPAIAAAGPKTTEAEFFGLHPSQFTTLSAVASDPTGKSRWSHYPPCRFAIEFWGLEHLKEKSRLYSHTIWYAGSLFNTYIQVVRKKNQVQLGIYLHRQSSIDPIPPASASAPAPVLRKEPLGPMELSVVPATHHRGPGSLPNFLALTHSTSAPSTQSPSRSLTPSSGASPISSTSSSTIPTSISSFTPATSAPVTPPQPYRDPRPSISAYFSISCASATGSSQTRFSSAPDVFSVSQSWGWKSSSLRTEEYMDVRDRTENLASDTFPVASRQTHIDNLSSFRATVVLGLV
ncbi:hypothetical protein H0H93_013080 [Arthromyces matolae]|nr:hypothetical protein H0H93_013080 [Arthromyces matolae]